MTERPILFSGPMVRAILEGRKTQTRRILKPQPIEHDGIIECGPAIAGSMHALHQWLIANKCPYGKPGGTRLWVREKHAVWHRDGWVEGGVTIEPADRGVYYWADQGAMHQVGKWTPSIHMPRWASRITLEVEGVRVERLQDITRGDAMAEGCPFPNMADGPDPRKWYEELWNQINGPGSWEANPWVWVVGFKVIKP